MSAWQEVLGRLLSERGEALTRYAYLMCGDPDDAQDLVQEGLVKMFGRLRGGYSVDSAEAYLRRIILNSYLDAGRSRTRWRGILHLQARDELTPEPTAQPEQRADLRQALMVLSPRERACVVLRYYEDQKVDDVAAALSISSGAVKRYLSDGLGKLQQHLERTHYREVADSPESAWR